MQGAELVNPARQAGPDRKTRCRSCPGNPANGTGDVARVPDRLTQNGAAWSTGDHRAGLQHQKMLTLLQLGRSVSHDQNRSSGMFCPTDRVLQCFGPVIVQTGVWFAQNQQHGIAEKRPGKSESPDLAARNIAAGDDTVGVGSALQTGDVFFGDGSVEKGNALRQIANPAAKVI